jgi:hypothetical protein
MESKEPNFTKIAIWIYIGMACLIMLLGYCSKADADDSLEPIQFAEEVPKQPKIEPKTGTYDTVKIDCGTLQGKGRVIINFGDDLYIIPVECK